MCTLYMMNMLYKMHTIIYVQKQTQCPWMRAIVLIQTYIYTWHLSCFTVKITYISLFCSLFY